MRSHASRLAFTAALPLLLVGCSNAKLTANMTPEEKAYMEQARAHPLTFKASNEEAPAYMDRALQFVSMHSLNPVETATDYQIVTNNISGGGGPRFHYEVRRIMQADSSTFRVDVNPSESGLGALMTVQSASDNAHILAMYMTTSILPEPVLIAGSPLR